MYNIPRSRDWILLLRRAFLLLSRTPGTNSLKSRRPSLTRGKMLIIARSNLPSLLSLSLSLSPFPSSREQTRYFENATFTRCCYSFTVWWTRVVARNSDYSEDKIETRGEGWVTFDRLNRTSIDEQRNVIERKQKNRFHAALSSRYLPRRLQSVSQSDSSFR